MRLQTGILSRLERQVQGEGERVHHWRAQLPQVRDLQGHPEELQMHLQRKLQGHL